MLAGGEAHPPYLRGKPLPGRRHPVKAVNRRSRAREQREPVPGRHHGDKQVETLVTITALARVSWRNPIGRRPHRA